MAETKAEEKTPNAPTQEEIELDQMAQAEMARLQRQYRIMEEDRQAYAEEVRTVLLRQRRQIASLEKEKRELAFSPEIAHLKVSKQRAAHSGRQLERKLEEQEEMEACIRAEKEQLSELQMQIQRLEREIEILRRGGESDLTRREALKNSERSERLLGDRLHHASVRFNSLLSENKSLREELDHLLSERGLFNSLYEQLSERLSQGRKLAAELTDQATQAYDQREEAQSRLQSLKEQMRGEADRHNADMSILQRQLDSVSKLHNFLGIKGQRRTTAQLEAQEALKQMSQREAMEKLLQAYAVSLEQVREFCSENDPDKLSALFTKQEEENFALFNYVNELNNELEVLEEQVEVLRRNVDHQKGQQEKQERQRQHNLTELETRLQTAKEEADISNSKLNESQDRLNELLNSIDKLFNMAYTEPAPILQLLGDNPELSSCSAPLFLELLEEKCSSLVLTATKTDTETEERSSTVSGRPMRSSLQQQQPAARPSFAVRYNSRSFREDH